MTFADAPAGIAVFVDANVFIYAFTPHPVFGPECDALFARIERQELTGYTSAQVLSDVAHRMMILEAAQLLGVSPTGMVPRLKRSPADVQRLSRYRQAIDEIALIGMRILAVTGSAVSRAADVSRQEGLLSSDALIVSVMRDHGLTNLASHDADLDRVSGLTRFAPV